MHKIPYSYNDEIRLENLIFASAPHSDHSELSLFVKHADPTDQHVLKTEIVRFQFYWTLPAGFNTTC